MLIHSYVAKRKIAGNFLWGGLGDEFKFHLVEWNHICSPTELAACGEKIVRF